MNLFTSNIFSNTLQTTVSVNVIAPDLNTAKMKDGKPCVLYLLHGLHGSHQSWITNSNILRYSADHNMVIVMPDMQNTFYVNNSANIKYLDFCAYELTEIIEKTFIVSDKREDTFICGLSMGGYGAFRIAFERPEKFAAAISLSGAMDIVSMSDPANIEGNDAAVVDMFKLDFGKDGAVLNDKNDLFYLAECLSKKKVKPKLLQYCGKQDYLHGFNIDFKNHMEKLDFDYSYFESDGIHNWDFWDDKIQDVLKRLKEYNEKI